MASTFNFAQYQQIAAQEAAQSNNDGAKVGYFRLKDDGDIAIARINLSSTDEFMFAAVHTINAGGKWLKVSCHNPLGMNAAGCALCEAHKANPKGSIGKSAKKLFIPMIVSYRDPNAATGYTTPVPVIWDRPAQFSRELANKLMIAGDLKNTLVLITRNGKANDMQTTYSVDVLPANHPVFKPEMVPADFSAFNNFNIAKHSYWEKTPEEINAFLTTGQFPERTQANTQAATNTYTAPVNTAPVNTAPAYTQPNTIVVNTTTTPYVAPAAPVSTATSAATERNFSGFSF